MGVIFKAGTCRLGKTVLDLHLDSERKKAHAKSKSEYKNLMKRYELFVKAKKVFDEKGEDQTKWKSTEMTSVLQSFRADGD